MSYQFVELEVIEGKEYALLLDVDTGEVVRTPVKNKAQSATPRSNIRTIHPEENNSNVMPTKPANTQTYPINETVGGTVMPQPPRTLKPPVPTWNGIPLDPSEVEYDENGQYVNKEQMPIKLSVVPKEFAQRMKKDGDELQF